jgi:hypothetical protein
MQSHKFAMDSGQILDRFPVLRSHTYRKPAKPSWMVYSILDGADHMISPALHRARPVEIAEVKRLNYPSI